MISEKEQNSKKLSFSKLFLEEGINIEFPIIQRDYAQGRDSAGVVRENFLTALYQYLDDNIPGQDLDFIYGDVDKNSTLIPLDGQQRLTTLFLLHWYLSNIDGKYQDFKKMLMHEDGLSRFSYKIRPSSNDFVNALLNCELTITKEESYSIAKSIIDSSWFFLSWQKDPTVKSMLRMLDAIHQKFKNTIGWYDTLVDNENPIITFQYLPLSGYGLTDDLYIKMNSRGKPLTPFENFKAKLEGELLHKAPELKSYELTLNEIKTVVDAKKYFSFQIDTKWADLFWVYKKEVRNNRTEEVDYLIDPLLMNFIKAIAINEAAIQRTTVKELFDTIEELPFSFFSGLGNQFYSRLIDILDQISSSAGIVKRLPENSIYQEELEFTKLINNSFHDFAYSERIKFFAYYTFLLNNKSNFDGFEDWMRVVCNMTKATEPYNRDTEYIGSIRSIEELSEHSGDILKHFADVEKSSDIKGFNIYQIKEEKIKAQLINLSKEWKEFILSSEKNDYFGGQLTFGLFFSGIESEFDGARISSWTEEENQNYRHLFENYIDKVFALFNNEQGISEVALKSHRLHRAVLSKGNYLIYSKSNLSFLNNSVRDINWRRVFVGDGENRIRSRGFIKQVIDDPLFDYSDLKSLEQVATSNISTIEPWQKVFIECPKVFLFLGPDKFIRFIDRNEIYLLRKLRRSGEHAELFTYAFYQNSIKNDWFNAFHRLNLDYEFAYTEDVAPNMFITGWQWKSHSFRIQLFANSETAFKLKIIDDNKSDIQDVSVTQFLNNKGLEIQDNHYQVIVSSSELKEWLEDFFNSIKFENS